MSDLTEQEQTAIKLAKIGLSVRDDMMYVASVAIRAMVAAAEQPAPTPRTDSTIGADKFVPAWKVRKDMGQLERELAAARAEAERLREALEQAHDAMEAFTDPEGNMPADTGEFRELKAAMLSIRPLLGVPK